MVPVGFFLVFCHILPRIADPPNEEWTSARLVPSVALARGYRIYYGPTEGPILGWSYPPVAPLAYLPATLWRSPGQSIRVGCVLSTMFYFLPAFVLIRSSRGGRTGTVEGWHYLGVGFLLICFYTLFNDYVSHSYALSYTALGVHCDAPALGCAAMSCALLLLSQNRNRPIRLQVASAVFAALAVWSKQVAFTLFLALPFWVLLTRGINEAIRYTMLLLGVLIVVSAVFVLAFGFPEIAFNVFALPGRRPWVGKFPSNVLGASLEVQKQALELFILPLAVLLYEWREKPPEVAWSRWFSENRWVLPLLVGFCMFPSSVMGRLLVGGDQNAFSFCLYFTLLATCALLVQLLARPLTEHHERLLSAVVVVLIAGVSLIETQNIGARLNHPSNRVMGTSIAYNFIKRHPGVAYFPQYPLAHLAAEGKLYHSGWALSDRELSRFFVSQRHVAAYIPPECDLIFFTSYDSALEKLVEGFEQGGRVPECPDWTVFRRRR